MELQRVKMKYLKLSILLLTAFSSFLLPKICSAYVLQLTGFEVNSLEEVQSYTLTGNSTVQTTSTNCRTGNNCLYTSSTTSGIGYAQVYQYGPDGVHKLRQVEVTNSEYGFCIRPLTLPDGSVTGDVIFRSLNYFGGAKGFLRIDGNGYIHLVASTGGLS